MLYPRPILLALLVFNCLFLSAKALTPNSISPEGQVEGLIGWLLDDDRDLTEIAFADVVAATAGVDVLPVDMDNPDDRRIIRKISLVMDSLLRVINDPGHPVHQVGRINEVSAHLEDLLLAQLNAIDGFVCMFPPTADGRIQRAGYPDLRLLDEASGRIFYLDPKLYATRSEQSAFRSFYFEPKQGTNKILDDASHLIVGIAHGGRSGESWTFLRWNLVDLHRFEVRLKAEFQASNRDLYRPEAIVAESEE